MKDQVQGLRKRGISAAMIGPETSTVELENLRKGKYNLSEARRRLLNSHRNVFRDLKNNIKAVFIDESHCIAKWGKDDKKTAAFRKDYGRLRSLLKKVPLVCVTATATAKTMEIITKDLCLNECDVIDSNPNRPNTKYSVISIDIDDLCGAFQWLIKELREKGQETKKVIVFCRKKEHMKELFDLFGEQLGDQAYHQPTGAEPRDDRSRLFAMYHKRTHKLVKGTIETEFCKADGIVRVVFCSIAFGMGVS
ncbi:ATP-dependent DNA helicase Q-like 2 [Nematostella vectensis]|uniref:ATP-dependent DNA helicase Q-like 2 n=1 Tax=Nematostella vectensis TaxID=45351 RepID=UPI0020773191|nr:ATP-dependent DNA helicase Q-like 2 [Nematostella vectensis]